MTTKIQRLSCWRTMRIKLRSLKMIQQQLKNLRSSWPVLLIWGAMGSRIQVHNKMMPNLENAVNAKRTFWVSNRPLSGKRCNFATILVLVSVIFYAIVGRTRLKITSVITRVHKSISIRTQGSKSQCLKLRGKLELNCRARLAGKAAGQGWQARLPGKAAGQGCRASLPGKAAGQGCMVRVHAIC
jgi:hypothetical protein